MRALFKHMGLGVAALGLAVAGTAQAGSLALEVDQSTSLRFKSSVSGVVVGNAGVADVIVHDNQTLLVVGKSVGTTHVLAVDGRGRTVYSGDVTVRAAEVAGMVTVQRGRTFATSICDTRCIPFPHSEASASEMTEAIARASTRTGFAGGGGGGGN